MGHDTYACPHCGALGNLHIFRFQQNFSQAEYNCPECGAREIRPDFVQGATMIGPFLDFYSDEEAWLADTVEEL